MSTQHSRRHRNYDRESGMDRVRRPKSNKIEMVETSESEFSSESEEDVKVAKKKILHKDFKEDRRRRILRKPSPPSSDVEDESPGTTKTTKQSGTADKTSSLESGLPAAPHYVLLSAIDKAGIIRPVYHSLNSFSVNFFGLFNLLHGLQTAMYGNTRINNYFGDFFSLGTRIYYAYLGYYQILRSKLAACVPLDAVERRVYRKLETTLPLESCPVAGCLVGWFQSLGAFKPSDIRYNWAYPDVQAFGNRATTWQFEPEAFFYPNVPLMVAFFRSLATANANHRDYVNQAGYIVPVRNVNNGMQVWLGENWQLDQATASGQNLINNFCRPGLSFALPETVTYLGAARATNWNRIRVPHVRDNTNTSDLEHFLLCDGANDLNWLRTFRNWANAEAKFAKGSVNLSQISPVTSASVLCLSEFQDPTEAPAEHTEPWINEDDNYFSRYPVATFTASALAEDADIKRAMAYQIIVQVGGVNNHLPAALNRVNSDLRGPLFREEAQNGTFTGNLRNRWKLQTTAEDEIDRDLRDLVINQVYSPMGEDPEPVRMH